MIVIISSQKTSSNLNNLYFYNLYGKRSSGIYILYLLFSLILEAQKSKIALLNSGSKVNTLSLAYIKNLSLKIRKTNVGA